MPLTKALFFYYMEDQIIVIMIVMIVMIIHSIVQYTHDIVVMITMIS